MTEDTEIITDEQEEDLIVPEIDSKYRMIVLAAQRSKQLQRGAVPRVDLDMRKTKPTRIAMRELENGKVNFVFTDQADNDEAPAV